MFNRLRYAIGNYLRIRPEDNVPEEVAGPFKRNVLANTLDIGFFFAGEAFVSVNTILPVFAATLTQDPVIIGLIPAIVNSGWYLPQVFMVSKVSKLKRTLPLTCRMSVLERIPFLFLPLLALAIPHISSKMALILLMVIVIFRGVASGFTALPWQELTARAIPLSHRARFWGMSRSFGQVLGVFSSLVAALILDTLEYPYNYALNFGIALIFLWLSYAALRLNVEPIQPPHASEKDSSKPLSPLTFNWDFARQVLKENANFRHYLAARIMGFFGNMASGFIAVYGMQRFQLADGQAGIFTGLLYGASILGYSIWGYLGDRIGPRKVYMSALLIWCLGLLLAILTPSVWIYYLVFIAYGLYLSGSTMGDALLVFELGSDQMRPAYMGLARTLVSPGIILAPILAGSIIARSSYPVMFAAAIGVSLVSVFLMQQVKDRPRFQPQGVTQQNEAKNEV